MSKRQNAVIEEPPSTRPATIGTRATAPARIGHEAVTDGSAGGSAPALRRSARWAGRAFGGVFVVGAAGACCGAIPLGFLLAAAGAAGLTAGLGVAVASVVSAAVVALLARSRRRAASSEACCAAPSGANEASAAAATAKASTVL